MRRAAKVDDNQKVIVKAFRQLGYTVQHTHAIGQGMTDIIVSKLLPSKHPFTSCIEIKDGDKPKSAWKLTPDEQEWHSSWQGELAIIKSVDEVLEYDDYVMKEYG